MAHVVHAGYHCRHTVHLGVMCTYSLLLLGSIGRWEPTTPAIVVRIPVDVPLQEDELADWEEAAGISAPLYEIVDTLFELQSRGFFRRQVSPRHAKKLLFQW